MINHIKKAILLLVIIAPLLAQEPDTGLIINKVNELMNHATSKSTMTMTITTSSGEQRTFEYLAYSKDKGEKNLMIYLAPNRVKGQKILMLNDADDIWAYFARTQRVRKLATHTKKQKMEGSDFSYEDMGASNSFINDFTAKKLPDEKKEGYDCYKLELTKKPSSSTSYAIMVMWVIKQNYVPVVIDYYEEDNPNRVAKTLVQSDIREIDGIPTGLKYVMTNKNDNTQTIMEIKEIEYNKPLDDTMFTERGLTQ